MMFALAKWIAHCPPPALPSASPAGEANHLLWIADSTQPDLASKPVDQAEALTLREQQQQIEVCLCVVVVVVGGGALAGSGSSDL